MGWLPGQTVYNLHASRFHTYFVATQVGAHPELVHNAGVCQIGQAGEAAVSKVTGLAKNNSLITGGAQGRIPDFIKLPDIHEAKNVKSLYYTSQLRDYVAMVGSSGKVHIYVNLTKTTRISKNIINNPLITVHRIKM